jgi:hypothetical protein
LEKFFQGFEWKRSTNYQRKALPAHLPEPRTMIKLEKLHKSVKLIEGTVGHLFTKQIRKRQKDFEPSINNFGLSSADLNTVLMPVK